MVKKQIKVLALLVAIVLVISVVDIQAGLKDRAFATHNVGKLGFFTTNIGQFYPYGGQFEKTIEYPINSGRICMYRQCLMIAVPYNVVSAADGRFEEFDAVAGFNAGKAQIAMSDNPATWPNWGWPVRDAQDNPVIVSQQDSYCVYSDSTNWRYYNNKEKDKLLDIRVHQSIYSWGVPDADKFVIVKLEIENRNTIAHRGMYLNFYSDLDIGGIGNSYNEWADDCIDFDKSRELVYFYDSDHYSNEWGVNDPFLAGVTFLKTPNGQGITDWHWIDVGVDEVLVNNAMWDSLHYSLMASDTMYFHNHPLHHVSDYFHLGPNPIKGAHYDDPATTRITDGTGKVVGGAMVAYICNGPFDVEPGQRVEFLIGVMVGDNKEDLLAVTDKIWQYYGDDFQIATVPAPDLSGAASDREVTLTWSNRLDVEYTNPVAKPPANDLQGYKLYRTTDPLLNNWQEIATIPMQFKEEHTARPAAYTHSDRAGVYNGFNYYYCLTAYRLNPAGKLEESVKLSDLKNIANQSNAIALQPRTEAATATADLERIKVVPNPYVLSARWDEARLGNSPFGEPLRNLAFTNLPSSCSIKIYSLDGDLVKTIEHNNGTGREEWNLLTLENRPVSSGVYFFHVKSVLGEKIGRFAVIR